jgi:ParB/RepB/Spo0J family partition protein
MENEFRLLLLEQLIESPTNPRRHFDKDALADLTASIKDKGVLVPLIVRKRIPASFSASGLDMHEVIAGARRFRAAKDAGLAQVPVLVTELDDDAALEIQLIENLQREDVHELDEAIGYEELLKRPGYTVDVIAEKVGVDRSYIYKRMKLCSLWKKARAAFFAEKIEMSVALLLARIPLESLQEKALDEVVTGAMSFKEASHHLKTHYMLLLDQAPFPVADGQLLKGVGACGSCPKNTGNQGDLFGEVHKGDLCTDPVCFGKKRDAQWKLTTADAAAAGRTVLSDKQAKQVFRFGDHYAEGHVSLSTISYEDPKRRTYGELLGGPTAAGVVLARDSSGKPHELVRSSDLPKLLKDAGHKFAQERQRQAPKPRSAPKQKVDPAVEAKERSRERALELLVKAAEKGTAAQALQIAALQIGWNDPGHASDFARRRKFTGLGGLERVIRDPDVRAIQGMAVELACIDALDGFDGAPFVLACTVYKVDLKQLEREALAQLKAAAAPPAKTGSAEKRANAAKAKPAKKKPAGPLARKAKG